jgi:hypothetical protein
VGTGTRRRFGRNEQGFKSLKTNNPAKWRIGPFRILIDLNDLRPASRKSPFRICWFFRLVGPQDEMAPNRRRLRGSRARRCAAPATRKWRRKPLKSLKTDSEMAPVRGRGRQAMNRSANSVSVLGHTYVRRRRMLHAHDMVASVDVDNLPGDPARHGRQEIDRAVANLLDGDGAAKGGVILVPLED